MSRSNRVSIDQMANEITDALSEYRDLSNEAMKAAVKKTTQSVQKEIKANAPRKTGAYAKSWRYKITSQNSHKLVYTVYSRDRYQLAHLLENGHRTRSGGMVRAFPHITPAEENGIQLLEQLFRQEIS